MLNDALWINFSMVDIHAAYNEARKIAGGPVKKRRALAEAVLEEAERVPRSPNYMKA